VRRFFYLPVLLALAAGLPLAQGAAPSERASNDEITYMASEEPAMREAFRQAAATLDEFLAAAARPRPGTGNYALKVAVSDRRNTEYFWVADFARKGEGFTGVLSNEPRLVRKYKNGQRFTFSRKQIVDWMYIDESQTPPRMMGNFTACALLTKEPPAEAEAFKKQYGLLCN
jgi:uncharacterized protein YegJ (DUF2314 family)